MIKRILVDGDACPVLVQIIKLTEEFKLPCIVFASFDHYSSRPLPKHVRYQYLSPGPDVVDFAIFKASSAEDLVVTQDYGLASLLLAKCYVMHQTGQLYSPENIEKLLNQRHHHQVLRRLPKGKRIYTKVNYNLDQFEMKLRQFLRQEQIKVE